MPEPVVIPRSDHPISRQHIDADALKVLVPAAAVRPYRLSCWRQRPGSAARPHAERFRHRHLRAPVSGQAPFPELLDHRTPLSSRPREVRYEGHRGRNIPPSDSRRHRRRTVPGSARRRACERCHGRWRSADSSRQHLRHAGGRRLPARLHAERAFLRHRDAIDHRLRRRAGRHPGGADPLYRRARGAFSGRSRPHASGGGVGGSARLQD